MAATTAEFYFRFRIGRRPSVNEISSDHLKLRLIYNYFRFGETDVRYIGILLPVTILTIISVIGMSFSTRLLNFIQIGQFSASLWCYIHFQDGGRYGAILLPVLD